MDVDFFRKLYDYHFMLNRRVWDRSISQLTPEQFTQDLTYSIGSIRNQCVHIMDVDGGWFTGLMHGHRPDFLDPKAFPDHASVREQWNSVEERMQAYLESVTDDVLIQPFELLPEMSVQEVLFHVVNHGTDHRAQLLAMLGQFDVPTYPQDYVFFVRGIDPSA